jgi:CheY-like chemotaxis protein
MTLEPCAPDVLMPGMSGADLMDKLRAHRPELTVLFISGYDRELVGHRERLPGVAFLRSRLLHRP